MYYITLEEFFEKYIKVKGVPTTDLPNLKNLKSYHKFKCCYCEKQLNTLTYTKEHLIPKQRYGNSSIYNVRPCCKKCNTEKKNMDINDYINYLRKNKSHFKDTHKKIKNALIAFYGLEYYTLLFT